MNIPTGSTLMPSVARLAVPCLAIALATACAGDARFETVAPPWVEFMREPGIRASLDTSRLERADAHVRLPLRFDYADPQPFPGDSTRFYWHMEWLADFRCELRQLRDSGLSVFDSTGVELVRGPPAVEGWLAFGEHPIGEAVPRRVCDQLKGLGITSI